MIQGKVSLREIGSKKLELEFSEADEWVVKAFELSAPHEDLSGLSSAQWAKNSTCKGHARIERLDPEYTIEGTFEARVPILCPRCGAEGSAPRTGSFRLFLHPVGPRETYEPGDDPDYLFLETPWLDMSSILNEQVVAAEPGIEYPDLEKSGKPHECEMLAANISLNSTGQNEAKAGNSPFAVLGQLKDAKPSKRGK